MTRRQTALITLAASAGLTILAAAGLRQPESQPEFTLPEGWTMEHMMACIEAGTPGDQHAWLAEGIGTWNGKGTMWMGPGADPTPFETTMTIAPLMEGR
jgi:hypothetical protein